MPRAIRHDGWTADRRHHFLTALAETGAVTRAAKLVGKSACAAYNLRNRDADFAAAWDAALAKPVDPLTIWPDLPGFAAALARVIDADDTVGPQLRAASVNFTRRAAAARPLNATPPERNFVQQV